MRLADRADFGGNAVRVGGAGPGEDVPKSAKSLKFKVAGWEVVGRAARSGPGVVDPGGACRAGWRGNSQRTPGGSVDP